PVQTAQRHAKVVQRLGGIRIKLQCPAKLALRSNGVPLLQEKRTQHVRRAEMRRITTQYRAVEAGCLCKSAGAMCAQGLVKALFRIRPSVHALAPNCRARAKRRDASSSSKIVGDARNKELREPAPRRTQSRETPDKRR